MSVMFLSNNLSLLKEFIDNGGDINIKNDSILYYSIEKDNDTCINFLIKNNININLENKRNNSMPLYSAILYNSIKCMEIFIKNGSDVNKLSVNGYTPLHYAVFNDNDEAIKILIKYGANINKPDEFGHTPLLIAIENDLQKSIHILKNSNRIQSNYRFFNYFSKIFNKYIIN
jgi:ankyrin repeat protein